MFLYCCDLDEVQNTFNYQFMQKSSKGSIPSKGFICFFLQLYGIMVNVMMVINSIPAHIDMKKWHFINFREKSQVFCQHMNV